MSTSAPPPPPPGGDDPRKGGPTHAISKVSPPPKRATRSRGNGQTAETAYWSTALWDKPNQAQYLTHRRNQVAPYPRWVRCTRGEAIYDAETGYAVYELDSTQGRRVNLLKGQPQREWDRATDRQIQEVLDEEAARVRRHEPLSSEDILEDVHEEYEGQDEPVFDKEPSTPTGKGSRGYSVTGSISSAGSGGLRRPGSAGPPTTPTRRGPGSAGSPLSPRGQPPSSGNSPPGQRQGQGSPSPRGWGSARSPTSPRGPLSPNSGRGRRPGGDGSPGSGAAST